MMIGQQKIEAVPQRSRLPTPASRYFVRNSPIRAVDTAKSYQQKKASGVSSRYCYNWKYNWQPNTSRTINRSKRKKEKKR
jgi:hypothetical protein